MNTLRRRSKSKAAQQAPVAAASQSSGRRLFFIDPRSLAAFRILIACVLLYDLAIRVVDLAAMYGPDAIVSIATARQSSGYGFWSLYYLGDSLWFQAALFIVAALLAAALLVGYRTRLATAASWVMLGSLHARMTVLVNGGDVLLICLLFWSMFLPLGCRWSLDVRLGRTPRRTAPIASIPAVAILLQMFMMYMFTGLSKFNAVWLEGNALHYALSIDAYVRPLGGWLVEHPLLTTLATYGTLAGELIFPLLLFCPWGNRYTRGLALVCFALLHVGVELTMTVALFSVVSLAGLTLFLPAEFWSWRPLRLASLWLRRLMPASLSRRRAPRPPAALVQFLSRPAFVFARDAVCTVLVVLLFGWNTAIIALVHYTKDALFAGPRPTSAALSSGADPAPASDGTRSNTSAAPLDQRPGPALMACAIYLDHAMPLMQVLRLDQRWDMFSHPPNADYRFVARAELSDGSQVDVLRGGAAVDLSDLDGLTPVAPNVRWMLLYMGLTGQQYGWLAQDLAEYQRRQWDAAHPRRRVANLELILLQNEPHDRSRFVQRRLAEIGARPGYRTVWGPDGEKLAEGPQRYGLRHGRWTVWELEDGKRFRREGRYVMGVAQDLWTYWYENGQMASRGRLRDGQRDGGWTYWYENGAKMQSGACHADLEQGPWTYWNPDGSLSGEATYKDGELDGRQVFYEADGAMRIEQYRNGEPVDLSL